MPEAARPLSRLLRELLFVTFSAERRSDPHMLLKLTRSLGERQVTAGETLFTAGDLPDFVYFMMDGRMRFTRPGSPEILREGRWGIGMHESIAMMPRKRTAVALADVRMLTVPAATWLEILDDRIELARAMATELARQVAGLHLRLGPQGGFAKARQPCDRPPLVMNVVERLLFLRGVPFFAGAGVQALADLARDGVETHFSAGEALFARGAPRDRIFIVISGLVEVEHSQSRVSARFGTGELVGGPVAVGDLALAWEARAVEPARTLALPIESWVDGIEDHFALFRSAVASLVDEREDLLDRLVVKTGENLFK